MEGAWAPAGLAGSLVVLLLAACGFEVTADGSDLDRDLDAGELFRRLPGGRQVPAELPGRWLAILSMVLG